MKVYISSSTGLTRSSLNPRWGRMEADAKAVETDAEAETVTVSGNDTEAITEAEAVTDTEARTEAEAGTDTEARTEAALLQGTSRRRERD
jgi:hypothetical protein